MKIGQWFLLDRDHRGTSTFPQNIRVYEGTYENAKYVRTITKYQAIAFMRWNENEWVSVLDGNGRYVDKTLVGDIGAWFGWE